MKNFHASSKTTTKTDINILVPSALFSDNEGEINFMTDQFAHDNERYVLTQHIHTIFERHNMKNVLTDHTTRHLIFTTVNSYHIHRHPSLHRVILF